MLHNPNLYQAVYPINYDIQTQMETFFVNTMWKDHKVNQASRDLYYTIDGEKHFKVCDFGEIPKKSNNGMTYCQYTNNEVSDNVIPLWLLGFLY